MNKKTEKTKPGNQDPGIQDPGNQEEILDGIRPTYNPERIRESCDKIETNYSYLRELTETELQEETDVLVSHSIRLANLENEKRDILVEIKSRIDPTKKDLKNSLEIVRSRKKIVTDPEVYIFFNRKKKIAEIYDARGVFISTRVLTLDELQTNFNFNEPSNH